MYEKFCAPLQGVKTHTDDIGFAHVQHYRMLIPPYPFSCLLISVRPTRLLFDVVKHCNISLCTVELHKRGPLLQTVGHPFSPATWPAQFCPLVSTAQAGGPPSVKIGWATKTIIFEDVRGHKMTSFFTCKFFGQFAVLGIFFSPCLLVKII